MDTRKLYPKKKSKTKNRTSSLCLFSMSDLVPEGAKDRCVSKCADCKFGQRNMREGRFQNIFKHWTNEL